MAEPLSVAASAAGLLSLCLQVTKGLIEYYDAFKTQHTEVARMLRDVETLGILLEEIDQTLGGRQFSSGDAHIVRNIETCIDDCREVIGEFESELTKFHSKPQQGPKAYLSAASRRTVYPFRISTLSKLGGQAREIKESLTLATNLLQHRDQKALLDKAEDQGKTLDLLRTSQMSSEIREWLQVPDTSIDFNAHVAKRHSRTGEWFVQGTVFRTWLQQQDSFVWLSGFAGCGKSVLCTTAIERTIRHAHCDPHNAVGYFYFSFSDPARQDLSAMLRSLLLQLSHQLDDGEHQLNRLRQRYLVARPNNHVLMAFLQQMVGQFHNVFILIDGVDECPRGPSRNELLDNIIKMRGEHLSNLHVLATSRSEPDISTYLDDMKPITILDLARTEGVNIDVKTFVKGQLDHHSRLQKHKKFRSQIENALFEKAGENFRWAECQLRILDQCPANASRINRCLQALPQTLEETYARMLNGIDEAFADDAKRVLSILCAVQQPILVEELIDALAINADTGMFDIAARYESADDLNEICPGFLAFDTISVYSDLYWSWFRHVRREQNCYIHIVRLAHFSIQEYLTSLRIQKSHAARFYVEIDRVKDDFAHALLGYLMSKDLANMRQVSDLIESYALLHVMGEEQAIARQIFCIFESYPLLHHAAFAWFDYIDRSASQDSRTQSMAVRFLNDEGSFRFWTILVQSSVCPSIWAQAFEPTRPRIDWTSSPEGFMMYHRLTPSEQSHIDNRRLNTLKADKEFLKLYYVSLLGLSSIFSRLRAEDNAGNMEHLLNRSDDDLLYGNCVRAAASCGHSDMITYLIKAGARLHCATEINSAAASGNTNALEGFLVAGIDPNINHEGSSPLYKAARSGQLPAMRTLIKAGADVNRRHTDGHTILEEAVLQCQVSAVRLLLSSGAKASPFALLRAVNRGYKVIGLELIRAGAEINTRVCKRPSPLQLAAQKGRIEFIDILLQSGATVDLPDSHGATALHYAVLSDNKTVVRRLLDAGALVDTRSEHGTALQMAAFWNCKEMCRHLIKVGANVNAPAGSKGTAMQCAIIKGRVEVVDLLLKAGADLDPSDPSEDPIRRLIAAPYALSGDLKHLLCLTLLDAGLSESNPGAAELLLQWALWDSQSPSILRALIAAGVDVNAYATVGKSIVQNLYHQQMFDCEELVMVLIESGARLTLTDEVDLLFRHAVECGHQSIARWALHSGASIHMASGFEESLLKRTIYRSCSSDIAHQPYLEMLQFLIGAGAVLDDQSGSNEYLLHTAITGCANAPSEWIRWPSWTAALNTFRERPYSSRNLYRKQAESSAVVKALLLAGANANNAGPHGTPLQLAVAIGTKDVTKLLIEARVDIDKAVGPGGTPLQIAVAGNGDEKVEIVKMLINAGADVNAEADGIGTVLQCALRCTSLADEITQVVKLLLDAGADAKSISHSDLREDHRHYPTPLAARNLLLRAGANISIRCDNAEHKSLETGFRGTWAQVDNGTATNWPATVINTTLSDVDSDSSDVIDIDREMDL